MTTIAERVKDIRKGLRLTQAEFGEKLGITKQAVANVEAGNNNPSIIFVIKLIEDLHINANWLLAGIGSTFLNGSAINGNMDYSDKAVYIPYLEFEGMPPEYFQDRIVTEVYYDKQIICDKWGYRPENLRATKMLGDKMSGGDYPMNNEDVLLVDITSKNIFSSGVYVFTTHNKNVFICGISKMMSGEVRFYFYNKTYPEKVYTDEQLQKSQFKVIGRVVKNATLRI